MIKCRLETMGKLHQRGEFERASAALDGMHGAKDRVDGFGIGTSFVHREQAEFHLGELLFALLEKRLPDCRHCIHGHHSTRGLKLQRAGWRR